MAAERRASEYLLEDLKTDFNVENNIRKDIKEMGWKYVQSRAGCCECRPNEYFCSLDCWGISGVSSKTGFWYLELIWFTVVSFNLVYLIGWLLT